MSHEIIEPPIRRAAGKPKGKLTKSDLLKVEIITLTRKSISDIATMSNLHGLTSLSLNDNEISDLKPLSGLSNLKNLNLANNKITDLTPLQTLEGLEQLDLSNNPGLTKAEIDRYKKTLSFLKTRRLKIIHNSK